MEGKKKSHMDKYRKTMIVINSANRMLASLCILKLENLKHVILVVKSVQKLIFRFYLISDSSLLM